MITPVGEKGGSRTAPTGRGGRGVNYSAGVVLLRRIGGGARGWRGWWCWGSGGGWRGRGGFGRR